MLIFRSPAKINLFLKIVSKRTDNYHNLASLFQAIDLHDVLHVELAEEDFLTCNDPSLPTDPSNLILKATRLFRRKTGLPIYCNVYLNKQIPMQAGLGGGE